MSINPQSILTDLIEISNTYLQTPIANTIIKWLKILLTYGSFLLPIAYFVTGEFKIFGTMALYLLVVIMVVRPLADIFPKVLLFKKLVLMRRSIGIFTGMAAMTHGLWFIYKDPSMLTQDYFYSFDSFLLYGSIASIFAFLLLITSNNISVKFLGKKWKWLQRGVHAMFYFTCIHLVLINTSKGIDFEPILLALVVFSIRCYAWFLQQKKLK